MASKDLDKLEKAFNDATARLDRATKNREKNAGTAQLTPGMHVSTMSKEQQRATDEEQAAQAAYDKARDAYYAAR